MNSPTHAPIAFAIFGSFIGLTIGGFNQCFPVWVGGLSGCSIGCAICCAIQYAANPNAEPVVINNIYGTTMQMEMEQKQDEVSGKMKAPSTT